MPLRRAFSALLLFSAIAFPVNRGNSRASKTVTAQPALAISGEKPSKDKLAGAERQWVQRWMRGMTLRDEIAQLVVIHSYGELPNSRTQAYRDFVHLVRDLHVGGITVVNRVVNGSVRGAEPYAMA